MIVYCHLLNDSSGSPIVLRAAIKALTSAGHEGILFIGSHGRGVLESSSVPIRRYWYRRSPHRLVTIFTYFVSQIIAYRSLTRSRDIPPDAVVFVNTLLPIGAMLWGRRTRRCVVVYIHEISISPAPLRRLLISFAARCADRLIYVSQDHYARLPISGPPAEVLFNPVDPALQIRSATAPAYAPRRSGAFEVLMLASLRGYKGVTEFMLLAEALRLREDIRFNLVLNADPAEVTAFAAHHLDACNVTLHPRTDNPATFYARADLLLNLSRKDQWIETFGLTLIEAMSFGVPVIAPPVGGPTEIVTHELDGLCIDSCDIDALKAAVLSLADNPARAQAMSSAARRRAADFTFDVYAERLRRILDDLQSCRAQGKLST